MNSRRSLDLSSDILDLIKRNRLKVGERIFEARLARHFGVSRAPIRAALHRLAEAGIVEQELNRGFVLQCLPEDACINVVQAQADEALYTAIVSDHFDGIIPESITEQGLVRRYGGKSTDLQRVLGRGIVEGWVERQRGYGWRFLEVSRQPEAYAQIMRLRRAIEPMGLLEPTYVQAPPMIDRLRQRQTFLLEKGLSNFSSSELFRDGCEFHEAIAQASGNAFLLETLRRLNAIRRMFSYRSIIPNHEYIEAHIHEHLRLLDIMETGDTAAASQFLDAHIR